MSTFRILVAALAAAAVAAQWSAARAERVCVEEAAGVCLKYETVTKPAPQKPAKAPAAAAPSSAAEREERALQLSREERRDVQAGLRVGGYYTGALDGAIGRGTRKAISRWQSDNGEAVTGYLTFDQVRELRRISLGEAPSRQPEPEPEPEPAVQPAPQPAPQQNPLIVIETKPAAPEPPARPARGNTYKRSFTANSPDIQLGGEMSVEVQVLRRDDATATLAFRLYDANQFAFSKECVVPVDEAFSCRFSGPNRNKNTWAFEGKFPKITLRNGWISFSKTWRLWE